MLGLFATFTALLYGPVSERVEVFGIKRNLFGGFENEHGEGPTIIPDTYAAEDIHYYEPANLIFGIAEPAGSNSRERWFPP